MINYLSVADVAHLIGVKPTSMQRYQLPEPDAYIGRTRGWKIETILDWDRCRVKRTKEK